MLNPNVNARNEELVTRRSNLTQQRTLTLVSMAWLVCIGAAAPAAAQSVYSSGSPGGVELNGLRHRPLGGASVRPTLAVRDLGSSGADGVAVDLGKVRFWDAEMRAVPSAVDFSVTLTVYGHDGGGRGSQNLYASSLKMREHRFPVTGAPCGAGARQPDSFSLGISPAFRSRSFRLEIFHGPTRNLELTGLQPGTVVFSGNDAVCEVFGKETSVELGICEWVVAPTFFADDDGRCVWIIDRASPVPWVVPLSPSGPVVGDRVRFTEEEPSSGPDVAFTEMRINASNLSKLVVDRESTRSSVPR